MENLAIPPESLRDAEPVCFRYISWSTCLLAIGCLIVTALWLPYNVARYAQVYADFRLNPPEFTEWLLGVPAVAFWTAAVVVGSGSILLQRGMRSKRSVTVVHLAVIVGCCLVFTVYHEVMQAVIFQLFNGMGSGARG